jgi:hypothetical protein
MEYMFFKATQRTKNVMKYNTHFRWLFVYNKM